jgi:hypothetical protein
MLNKSREALFADASNALRRGNKAQEEIRQWPPSWLVDFYLDYPVHQDELKQATFDTLWQRSLDNMTIPGVPDFRLVSQPNLSNADLVVGFRCYLLAMISKQENRLDDYASYLTQSMEHHSFHAHQTYLHDMVMQSTYDLAVIAKVLASWASFSNRHGLPGYLLIANGYQRLAEIASSLKLETVEYVAASYTYFELADLSKEHSEASIKNAYFGIGLSLSNPDGWETIREMVGQCLSLGATDLTEERKRQVKANAERIYHSLRQEVEAK